MNVLSPIEVKHTTWLGLQQGRQNRGRRNERFILWRIANFTFMPLVMVNRIVFEVSDVEVIVLRVRGPGQARCGDEIWNDFRVVGHHFGGPGR